MFDVGFWELALVAAIALIVLGPERLPVVARTAGRLIGRARMYARGLTSELEREVDVQGFRDEINNARDSIESEARRTVDEIKTDTDGVVEPLKDSVADINAAGKATASTLDEDASGPHDHESQGQDDAPASAANEPHVAAEQQAGNDDTATSAASHTRAGQAAREHENQV